MACGRFVQYCKIRMTLTVTVIVAAVETVHSDTVWCGQKVHHSTKKQGIGTHGQCDLYL